MDSLARGLGVAIDRQALVGGGTAGEIWGIYNYPNIQTVDFGRVSATWAKVVNFQRQILDAKGRVQNIRYVAAPNVREAWQTKARFTSGGSLQLWDDAETVAGRVAYTTTSMANGNVLAGDFSSMAIGFFSNSVDTIVDPYSQAARKSALIEILCTTYADAGTWYPKLWVINLNNAAL